MAFNVSDKTYEIYLNSKYDKFETDTVTDWTTEFSQIALNPNKNYQVGLSSLQIPNTAPQFHQTECNFDFVAGTTTYSKVYNRKNIFDTVADMISEVQLLFNVVDLDITQDAKTKKTKIFNGSGDDIILKLSTNNAFYNKLGILGNEDILIMNTETYISEGYPSILSTTRYYVVCEEIKNNSYVSRTYNNWSVFKDINCNVGFGSYCNFQTNNNIYFHDLNTSTNINNLSFRILDDRLRPVELSNNGVLMSLYIREI